MKSIITLIFFIFLSQITFANDWIVIQKADEFWLQNVEESSIKCQIISLGGTPRFEGIIRIEKISPILILKYFAGTSGTSFPIDEYWAVIYSPRTKIFLGNYPYDYESYSDEMGISDPVWSFSKNVIHITDEESFIDTIIKLKLLEVLPFGKK